MTRFFAGLAAAVLLPFHSAAAQPDQWPTFNGDAMAQKYSPAAQITPQNVERLRKAWSVHTGDVTGPGGTRKGLKKGARTSWRSTPLFVNDTVYVSTPYSTHFRGGARHRQGQVDLQPQDRP